MNGIIDSDAELGTFQYANVSRNFFPLFLVINLNFISVLSGTIVSTIGRRLKSNEFFLSEIGVAFQEHLTHRINKSKN